MPPATRRPSNARPTMRSSKLELDAPLYCSCCGRRYGRREVAELLTDARTLLEHERVDAPPARFGVYAANRLREAGFETVAEVARAGDSLLDVHGIGPATLEQIEQALEAAWAWALGFVGASPVAPNEAPAA